jgi:hypothetical protein
MDIINDRIEPAHAPAVPDGMGKNAPGEAGLTQAVRWSPPVLAATKPGAQSRNPSLPTFVGLIILILTFFIVLTSISMRDRHRSDAAIASLQDAFSGSAARAEGDPAKKDEEIARDFIAGLTQRIQSLIPLMGGKKGPVSDHQVLWLPVGLAFSGEDAALAPSFATVLREVVNALRSIPARLAPHIEMRLCTSGAVDQLRARAGAIGVALSREHAPLDQFSIGVAQCDPKVIGIAVALTPATQTADPKEQAP